MNMIVRGFAAAMLVIQTASVIEARAQSDENNIDTEVYIILRTAIAERLATALDSAAVNPTDVRKFAEDALNEKWSSLRATFPFSGEGKLAEAENVVAIVRNRIIQNIGTNRLEKGDFQTVRDAVDAYLTNVLDESLDFTGTRLTGTNALSDYHTLLGLSWTHPESGTAAPLFEAAVYFRSRLWDYRRGMDGTRKWRRIDELTTPEEWFLDLLVDAQFLTSEGLQDSVITETRAKEFLLTQARSSRLSTGLFVGTPPIFSDYGIVGAFLRFSISTQENSEDIFRRAVFGLRLENRSNLRIRGANVELGLAADEAAASTDRSEPIFGTDRLVLRFQLPLRGDRQRAGLFIEFHGEWSIKNNEIADATPPIYQFRLGTTFDPVKLLSPIFGFAN